MDSVRHCRLPNQARTRNTSGAPDIKLGVTPNCVHDRRTPARLPRKHRLTTYIMAPQRRDKGHAGHCCADNNFGPSAVGQAVAMSAREAVRDEASAAAVR